VNLFYLHSDPKMCAQYHVDAHVVKMPVEYAQCLSTVLRLRCGINFGYKPVYRKHPVTQWTGQNINNFAWMLSLGFAVCAEYTHRFGRVHASQAVLEGIKDRLDRVRDVLPDEPMTEPPKCVSPQFKHLSTIKACREYYRVVKARLHRWTDRKPPSWIGVEK